MGNYQTNEQNIIDVELTHPRFVNSKLVKVEDSVHVQTAIPAEEKDYEVWRKLVTITQQPAEHLFLPLTWSFSTKNLCGSSGHALLNFPYFPYLLSQEIYNRLGKKTRFQETDLWYLLFSLTAAKEDIRKYGLAKVGDVRTGNVFLNDEGRVKVGCAVSWPNEMSVWEKAIDRQLVYLAPEDFDRLSKGQAENDSYQSQVFAIGLTLLNSGLLIDDSNAPPLYDYKQSHFNYPEYNRRLNDWILTRGYSEILKSIVINLCSLHPESRIMQEELWDLLRVHEEDIKNRKNFIIANAPAKIHQEVKRYREARGKLTAQMTVGNNLKELQTSTVVKHEIAHGVGLNNFLSNNPVNTYPLDQQNVTTNLETVVSGNLQTSEHQDHKVTE